MLVYSTKTDIINYHIKKIDINTPPWHTISYSECNNNIHLSEKYIRKKTFIYFVIVKKQSLTDYMIIVNSFLKK
jgi:hypothetical protein